MLIIQLTATDENVIKIVVAIKKEMERNRDESDTDFIKRWIKNLVINLVLSSEQGIARENVQPTEDIVT